MDSKNDLNPRGGWLKSQFDVSPRHDILTFVGIIIALGGIAFYQSFILSDVENIFVIGSMGATSTLIFAAYQSPLVQPRNLFGGHIISAFVGVSVYKIFPDMIYLSAPIAGGLAIIAMKLTRTLHPPGGAIALIAVGGTEKISHLGYWYILSPVLSGALILFIVALIINNLNPDKQYPVNSKIIAKWRIKLGIVKPAPDHPDKS